MNNQTDPAGLLNRLSLLTGQAVAFFDRAKSTEVSHDSWAHPDNRDYFWSQLPEVDRNEAGQLVEKLLLLSGSIVEEVRTSALASEADRADVQLASKTMRAALLLRKFEHWNSEVLHDEGTFLGIQPAGQSDDYPLAPSSAKVRFLASRERLDSVLKLVEASSRLSDANGRDSSFPPARYRPGTAFIMMAMDPANGALIDVADAVKSVFEQFDIRAVRADDIEHEGLVTQKVLDEVQTSEFLFADLTGGRPNVYYEVGFAHALKRRVMLFRAAGTGLHFDLAGYNCPEYENLRDLKDKLTRRLEFVTNRPISRPK